MATTTAVPAYLATDSAPQRKASPPKSCMNMLERPPAGSQRFSKRHQYIIIKLLITKHKV